MSGLRIVRWFSTVLVLAVFASLFSQGAIAATSLGKALKYFDRGDYKPAVLLLKSALQKDPNDVEARFLLGRTYVRLGLGQAAAKELRWARRLGMDEATLTWPLGRAYLLQDKGSDLLSEFRIRDGMTAKQLAEVLTLRGQAEIAGKNIREAKRLFEQAIENQPGYAQAQLGLAQIELGDKHYRAAERLLDAGVGSDSSCTECWVGLGEARRLQGNLAGAGQAFQQALALEPKHPMANLGLATIAIEGREIDKARTYLEAANETLPNHPLKDYLDAVIAFDGKDLDTASEKVNTALKALPSHPPSVLLSGSIAFLQGQYAKAIEQLERYTRMAKPTKAVRLMLASSELEQKRTKQAIEWLRPLVQANSADPQVYALFARAYQQQGDFESASRYLKKVTKQAPDSSQARARLAINELMGGNTKAGVAGLEALANESQADPGADVLLVLAALQTRDYEKAVQAAQALIKKQPGKAMPLNLLGVAYLGLKEEDQARSSFESALKQEPEFVTAALNLARMDARNKAFEAAKQWLNAVLKHAPKNVPAMLEMAKVVASELAGQPSAAKQEMRWIRAALSAQPESRDAGLALVRALLQQGDVKAALNAARTLFESYASNADVIDLLARTQLAAGEASSAVASYRKLLKLRPGSPEVTLRLATALATAGNYKEALEFARKAHELAPSSIRVRERMIRIAHASGDLDAAISEARMLQKDWPQLAVGYVLEADVHHSAKRPKQAIQFYRKAFRKQPSAALALRLSQISAKAGEFAAAVVPLEDWVREHAGDANMRLALSTMYQRAGQMDDAASSYQQLLKLQPENAVALNNLALIYQKLGDPQALKVAEKAYRLAGDQLAVMDTYGWLLVKAGKAKQAVKVLESAMAINDQVAEVRYHLAAAYAEAGMKAKAKSELERLMVRGKAFPGQSEAKELLRRLSR